MSDDGSAPGAPGIAPRWTSSAKSGVGTAASQRSRVWFTISHGILNEIYYPRLDQANTRDMGLIVTAGSDFFSEEKRHTTSVVETIAPGVPGYRLTNTCTKGRYRIVKTILTDPDNDVVLQHTRFDALTGSRSDYRLYILLAPHLGNQGAGNSGWIGDYKGVPMLFAQRESTALALACSGRFAARSCGFVGRSDGWQQLHSDNRLSHCYREARNGNIALTAQVDLEACDGQFIVALAFGPTTPEAGQAARSALLRDFEGICDEYITQWTEFHQRARDRPSSDGWKSEDVRFCIAVLKTHEDKGHPGALIASLSVPWGSSKGDQDLGGYHVVWPRDLTECASALSAGGHANTARDALHYFAATQEADGHWPQNMWLDGRPWWPGNQLDETGFVILLAGALRRDGALGSVDPWPMIRSAAAYLVRHGPATPEDRWEEEGGYSPFTLSVEIAALLVAADFADAANEPSVAQYLRETADAWNDSIERWTYVRDTELARSCDVDGYYVRISPRNIADQGSSPVYVDIKNQPGGAGHVRYEQLVSTGALALVRFGLRAANDPRIANTVQVIDRLLKTDTPTGPVWHRYNDDGYGEHADGSAYDGTGIGRGWPLLAGERAHYELAAGNLERARYLAAVMQRQASPGGLIPEQVWDTSDIPARELYNGHPSGSAMPLAWAHAEYVKLARSIRDGRVFDMPPETSSRYLAGQEHMTRDRPVALWRFDDRVPTMRSGRTLRIQAEAAFVAHWSGDDWHTVHDSEARDTGIGLWAADLATSTLSSDACVRFTFYWPDADRWEGTDYQVRIVGE